MVFNINRQISITLSFKRVCVALQIEKCELFLMSTARLIQNVYLFVAQKHDSTRQFYTPNGWMAVVIISSFATISTERVGGFLIGLHRFAFYIH